MMTFSKTNGLYRQVTNLPNFLPQDGTKFGAIGALYSELVAVSNKGELYQWKWNESEPYRNTQVWNSNLFQLSSDSCIIEYQCS